MTPHREYSNRGVLLIEGSIDIHGLKEGLWKEYDRDGSLIIEEMYYRGKRHGAYKTYHNNGKLWCYGWFFDDKKHGKFKIFDRNQHLIKTQLFLRDQLVNEYKET